MSTSNHTSPKSTTENFQVYPIPSTTQSRRPSSHPIDTTSSFTSTSTSSKISSRRSSSSNSSSSSSSSSISRISLDDHPSDSLLLHTRRKQSLFRSSNPTSTYTNDQTYRESIASTSTRLFQTLRPRRRSSLPFVHIARRKSTQLVLSLSVIILSLLLISEIKSHKVRRELWEKEYRLNEWDIRNSDKYNSRETNLASLREDYESNRRLELFNSKIDGKKKDKRGGGGQNEIIWGPKDEELLKLEVTDIWPSWWGNPDIVGKSPFDHSPIPLPTGQEKRRFMFLTDYNDYLERMNTHTYEIVDAALRHPHLIVDVWGPGWEGYDRSIPLSANIRKRSHRISQLEKSKKEFDLAKSKTKEDKEKEIKRLAKREWISRRLEVTRSPTIDNGIENIEDEEEIWTKPNWSDQIPEECSDVKFDVVFTISNIYSETDPHVDALDCDALLIQQLGDCHELRCSYEWYPHANNITVSKYAFELLELFEHDKVKAKYPDWQMGMFGHSPDTGNEWDFYPVRWADKTAHAKVFGYDGSFYPIRTTVTDYLRLIEVEPNLPERTVISRHPHPGYSVSVPSSARDQPLETYELEHEYYETHLKLREDFAKGMRESKICIFDASLERKMIRKYAQAFLSGCVVASDLPTEHEEALSKFVIPLKSSWTIEKINEVLRYYLEREDLLQQMALDGLIWARQHLTTTNKVTHLLQMTDHYRHGSRGYEFPYGFSMRCRSYWSGDDSYRPPWCPQQGYRGLEE
ncbi:uncharacterized protein IL334_006618 [Kwoniella shivajii]|uniref:Glycosyl transferase CAP10 domain-containing protein n=1 Tax=Kwoniella shivajii TaxID=564305 RepID=A0ABZ1D848_9TREE|nr:hypothetical protein IL334_006618 [Kwoniella shivajii]